MKHIDTYKFQQIPPEDAPKFIGKFVHVGWAYKACNWILIRIEGEKAVLMTPKTRKFLTVKLTDLYKTRKHETTS